MVFSESVCLRYPVNVDQRADDTRLQVLPALGKRETIVGVRRSV